MPWAPCVSCALDSTKIPTEIVEGSNVFCSVHSHVCPSCAMGKSSKKARTAAPPVASPYMGMPGMPGMPMMYAMPHYMSPQPQGPQPQVEVLPWGKAKKNNKKQKQNLRWRRQSLLPRAQARTARSTTRRRGVEYSPSGPLSPCSAVRVFGLGWPIGPRGPDGVLECRERASQRVRVFFNLFETLASWMGVGIF